MIEALIKLINVRTIITIMFGIGYHVFISTGTIPGTGYEELVKFIIYFYFGTQVGKAMETNKGGK